MSYGVVVGIDGSARSATAAAWAAREALRRGIGLRMVHVAGTEVDALERDLGGGSGVPEPVAVIRDRIAAASPGLDVSCEIRPGSPADDLAAVGRRAELLVLGSRGLGGFAGLLVGSVGLRTAARAGCPVVLVPAGAAGLGGAEGSGAAEGSGGAPGEVVVGVEGDRPCDAVLDFAFRHAADTGAVLRAVECRHPSHGGPYTTEAPVGQRDIGDSLAAAEQLRLQDALDRWRGKYPQVRTEAELHAGSPAGALVAASRSASLLVLGRRTPKHTLGAPRLGAVTQSVLHHAHGPVAIVPHD
ncbi:universal stress protein [Kitasatospora sp. A2-31]|uniref:universal stress protein n=1 Tax=Kitasatospora sp. A2-31 TaxID=2916414 RepID=UPI001EEC88CC|nr:universal stress protein [Kitasatospora sp. A2-31]MCG6494278.1 universal stress protein [Kitasatospora sp. A2-31]